MDTLISGLLIARFSRTDAAGLSPTYIDPDKPLVSSL